MRAAVRLTPRLRPQPRYLWLPGRCARQRAAAMLPSMSPVIEVRSLRKTYGDTVAVDDISFTVAEGEIFGILGPNGAGKTTTVECIEGLRKPDGGEISVLGLDPLQDRA